MSLIKGREYDASEAHQITCLDAFEPIPAIFISACADFVCLRGQLSLHGVPCPVLEPLARLVLIVQVRDSEGCLGLGDIL